MLSQLPLLVAVLSLVASLAPLASRGALLAQSVTPPARRGTAAQIQTARAAFASGVSDVSRNPSAFFQDVTAGSGCSVTLSASRPEKADSLRESHAFDAGHLSTKSRMSIHPSGGVILLSYATVDGGKSIARTRSLVSNGGVSPPVVETAAELVVLVAETSRQSDVTAFIKGWSDLVHLCGGERSADS